MKIQNRQQFLVALTIAALALLISVDFIFTPLAGWWHSRSAQIKDLRDKVSNGQQLIRREAGIRSHWSDMQGGALPANNSLAEQRFLKALDSWRNETGVELTSITPQWKSDSTNYMTLACHIELGGNLGSLSRYLYDLEKGQLALHVDTVQLNTHDNTGQQLTLGLDVDGLALTQPEKK